MQLMARKGLLREGLNKRTALRCEPSNNRVQLNLFHLSGIELSSLSLDLTPDELSFEGLSVSGLEVEDRLCL